MKFLEIFNPSLIPFALLLQRLCMVNLVPREVNVPICCKLIHLNFYFK
jgi:hypothetical protein